MTRISKKMIVTRIKYLNKITGRTENDEWYYTYDHIGCYGGYQLIRFYPANNGESAVIRGRFKASAFYDVVNAYIEGVQAAQGGVA